jgi:predicted permease
MAVRTALGAGRARLVRLLLVESLIVSIIGTLAGIVVAFVGMKALVSTLPAETPRLQEIAIDLRVLGFAFVLCVTSAILFGLLPALRSTGIAMTSALRSDDRSGVSRSTSRAGFILATAQIALAVTLVSGAGLLIKSFWQMRQVDLGFRTRELYTAEVPLPAFPNDTANRAPLFFNQVERTLAAMPGVRAAALASSVPFGDGIQVAAMAVEAHPTPQGAEPPAPNVITVSPNYFATLGIPLVRGRVINDADRSNTGKVGVIDEVAASRLWPNEDPIGQRIRFVWNRDWYTVVGIVGNVKRDSMSSVNQPSLYLPMEQTFIRDMRVIMEAPGSTNPASLIQAAVKQVDATVPISDVRSLDGLVAGSATRPRFAAMLLGIFSVVALMLGAVGIHGVLSAAVTRRTREFGVRMALGATSGQVLRMVLSQSFAIASAGIVLGVLGVVWGTSLLRGMLFGVGPTDVTVLAGVVVVLALVTIVSSAIPARRATRVDPLTAIRAE